LEITFFSSKVILANLSGYIWEEPGEVEAGVIPSAFEDRDVEVLLDLVLELLGGYYIGTPRFTEETVRGKGHEGLTRSSGCFY